MGQPPYETPEIIREAGKMAIDSPYTPICGTESLRRAIADKLSKENGLQVSHENIVVTSGADAGITISLMAAIEPGDEVLIPDPGWLNVKAAVQLIGGKPVTYPLKASNGFNLVIYD